MFASRDAGRPRNAVPDPSLFLTSCRRPPTPLVLASSLLAFSLLAVTLGCGGSPADNATPDSSGANVAGESRTDSGSNGEVSAAPTAREPKIVAADSLPIGDPMPPLDGGKLELARPTDWSVPSRDSKYVVQFQAGDSRYPRIQVTAEDDWWGKGDLTEENVVEFAAAVQSRLEEQDVALVEPALPMVIGGVPAARYVRRTRFRGTVRAVTVERQIVATILSGRVYEIDLQTEPGALLEHRDAGYAVVASMKAPE